MNYVPPTSMYIFLCRSLVAALLSSFVLHPSAARAAEPFGVKLYPEGVKGCKARVCAEGVYVDEVVLGSRAERSGLRRKDLITKISGAAVTNPRIVSGALDGAPDGMQMIVFRGGKLLQLETGGAVAPALETRVEANAVLPQSVQAINGIPAESEGKPRAAQRSASVMLDADQHRGKTLKQTAYLQQLRKTMRLMVKTCAPGDIRIGGSLPPGSQPVMELHVRYRVQCPHIAEVVGTIHGYRGGGLSCADSDMRPIDLACRPMDARIIVEDVTASD